MEIANGELLDSEIVEDGEEEDVCDVRVDEHVDFTNSKSNPYVLPPPPLKHEEDISIYK